MRFTTALSLLCLACVSIVPSWSPIPRADACWIAPTQVALCGFLGQRVYLNPSIDAGCDAIHAANTFILLHVENPLLVLNDGVCWASGLA